MDFSVHNDDPSLRITAAATYPTASFGIGTTHDCFTPSMSFRNASISTGDTLLPQHLNISFFRSSTNKSP